MIYQVFCTNSSYFQTLCPNCFKPITITIISSLWQKIYHVLIFSKIVIGILMLIWPSFLCKQAQSCFIYNIVTFIIIFFIVFLATTKILIITTYIKGKACIDLSNTQSNHMSSIVLVLGSMLSNNVKSWSWPWKFWNLDLENYEPKKCHIQGAIRSITLSTHHLQRLRIHIHILHLTFPKQNGIKHYDCSFGG